MAEPSRRSMSRPPPRALLAAAAVVVVALLPGCVTVYEPLLGLQRPVVVNLNAPNFEGQRILVRCLPSDHLPAQDMEYLCRRVRNILQKQGAEVEITVPRGARSRAVEREEGVAPPDLMIELSGRLLHEDNVPILWALSYATLTLVPTITEFTFAQDVSIRDGEGSLLVSDSLQGRIIQYFGAGVWATNAVLDLAVRKESEKINDEASRQELSRDLLGQISQLAFHARTRARVLRGFPPEAKADAKIESTGPAVPIVPAVPAPAAPAAPKAADGKLRD